MKSLDQSAIRKQNVRRILELLTAHFPCTRQFLAEETGLSLMTVTNLVDQLKEQQVLELSPVPRCSGKLRNSGRKAENISLRGCGHAWLIVDLSGKHFRYTLLGFDLMILHEKNCTAEGEYLSRLTAFLSTIREEIAAPLQGRELLGVAVVTPGPYEISCDTVYNQRLPELNNVGIKALMQRCLGSFDYYVDEDVKFAVRAFAPLIKQDSCELLYYLFIGEGVGGAAVHNGNMLRGLNATAGDAGQLTTPNGVTFESLLSLSSFAEMLGCHAQENRQIMAQLQEIAERQPEVYLSALKKAAVIVGDMLYCVLWALDPSHLIIDCRYALSFREEFNGFIAESLKARLSTSARKLPALSAAPLGMSSVIRGAVQVLQREWIERLVN